jgi:hypothetical protein
MSILLSILLLLAPVKVERGRFNVMKDGKKIGTDEFAVTMKGTNYLLEGKATFGEATISSKMELDSKLVPLSYEVGTRDGRLRVNVASPISEIQTIIGGDTSSADFRFPEGGVILDNNFFHHYLILLYRAQMGQTNFSVFVPQDKSLGSATIRNTGPRAYELQVGDVHMQATTDADGGLIRLVVPGANVVVER